LGHKVAELQLKPIASIPVKTNLPKPGSKQHPRDDRLEAWLQTD